MFKSKLENLIHKLNFFTNSGVNVIHLINGNVIPYSPKNNMYGVLFKKIIDPIMQLKNINKDKNTLINDNSIFYYKISKLNSKNKEYFFTSIDDNSTSLNTMKMSDNNDFLCIENLNIEEYDCIKKNISKRYIDRKTLKKKSVIETLEINSLY